MFTWKLHGATSTAMTHIPSIVSLNSEMKTFWSWERFQISIFWANKFLSNLYKNEYHHACRNSYTIRKPTLVWTVTFWNRLYPLFRITILAGIGDSYGLKSCWLTSSLSLKSIRKNDWADFLKGWKEFLWHFCVNQKFSSGLIWGI